MCLTRNTRFLLVLALGIAVAAPTASPAQEPASSAPPKKVDFTPRDIPLERRATASQETEVMAGVAPMPAYNPANPPSQQFGSPVHCVQFSNEGLVYVCDRVNDRYQVFRKDGTFVSESFFEKNTLLNGSVSDLVLSNDTGQTYIYMVDGVNNELRVVDRKSSLTLARLGRPGRMAGQFHVVHDIAIDRNGNLYTTEVNTGQRVQKFRRVNP